MGKSLYSQINKDEDVAEIEFEVKCSYVEIYNETIFDLLDSFAQQKLQIREDKGLTFLENCVERHVKNKKEVLELIRKGHENRHIASTNMNMESSRSHAVFTAFIKTNTVQKNGKKAVRTSRFHIVDLAGSERIKDTHADGQRLKELCKINTSLSNLGKVIYELSENSKRSKTNKVMPSFVNFRESKLTHLLKDSLGGNAKTVMICTLNPHMSAIKETISTLKFAQRAKMIRNKAVVNEESSDVEYWKKKYLELQKKAGECQMQVDQSESHRDDASSKSWNKLLSEQVRDYTGWLKDS